MVEEGDLIAKRTRSQLPLQDVPIESIEGNSDELKQKEFVEYLINHNVLMCFVIDSNISATRLHCRYV